MQEPYEYFSMDDEILLELSHELGVPQESIDSNLNLHQLGGNSITALAVSRACKQRGIFIDIASILSSDSINDILLNAKSMPTRQCCAGSNISRKGPVPCTTSTVEGSRSTGAGTVMPNGPLSSQGTSKRNVGSCEPTDLQSIFVLEAVDNPNLNVISYFQEYSPSEIPGLKLAWLEVIKSEPIFRTRIHNGALTEDAPIVFSWSETVFHDYESFQHQVDMVESPKMTEPATEFNVFTFKDCKRREKSILVWHIHHALVDGYSAARLLNKTVKVRSGIPITDGPSFVELARGLRMYQTVFAQESREFWRRYFESVPMKHHDLRLPAPVNAENIFSENPYATGHVAFSIPVERLLASSRQRCVPSASIYYAAWALVLAQYTDSNTVSMGAAFANRSIPIPGILETVGPAINTLPLTLKVDQACSTDDFVKYVAERIGLLSKYQWSQPQPTPNYLSALALQYDYDRNLISSASHSKSYTRLQTKIPIHVFLGPGDRVQINYHKRLYNHADIATMSRSYTRAIEILLESQRSLRSYFSRGVSDDDLQTLLKTGNCFSNASFEKSQDTLKSLFKKSSLDHRDTLAVVRGDCSITYADLNTAVCKVSEALRSQVIPGEVVCVYADRSINWIIAAHAVIQANAVYCPFDASSPKNLRDSYFEISGSRIFLATDETNTCERPSKCEIFYSVEQILSDRCNLQPSASLCSAAGESRPLREDAAYLCFTSGSTGFPKGVVCTHHGLVAFQKDYNARLRSRPGLKIAQIMSPAFDGSIHEIFSCSSYGGTLILNDSPNPFQHLAHVDVAILTPSIARLLQPSDYTNLEAIYFIGEPLPQSVADTWSALLPCYNMYGPTESTCGSTCKRLIPGERVTIGMPVSSTRIYILDDCQNLVPPGAIGEVYTAGVQVSPGYIGRPDETAKRFLTDSICGTPSQMMYRTGDRGYWTSTGEIVLLGRLDRQIKLRGFRIDLDDLEIKMLNAHPAASAVAITRKDDFLVAFVRPETVNEETFRNDIRKCVPQYAIPRFIRAVADFPLVSAGKIDYKSIASTIAKPENGTELAPSFTRSIQTTDSFDLLKPVSSIWRTVLNLDDAQVLKKNSNFFDLGGNSVDCIALTQSLSSMVARQIPLYDILQRPSLGDQVLLLQCSADSRMKKKSDGFGAPYRSILSPIERDWFDKYRIGEGSASFNVSFACSIDSRVNLAALSTAWNQGLKRHRVMSSLFHDGSVPTRSYAECPPQVIWSESIDLAKEVNRSFQLSNEPPIRVFISSNLLLMVASHIFMDFTTLRVILGEVEAIYNGELLPSVKIHYEETSQWNRTVEQAHLDFWSWKLSHVPQYPITKRDSFRGTSRVCKVPSQIFQQMKRFSTENGVTLHQLSLAAVALVLRVTNSSTEDVVLGAPYLNREFDDIETVGLFLEPLPVPIQSPRYDAHRTTGIKDSLKFSESESFIQIVRRSSQAAIAHAIPWDRLLDHLGIKADHPNVPLIEAMVTFHHDKDQIIPAITGLEPLYTWSNGSKFNLLVEFSAFDAETLILRMEHDDRLYEDTAIGHLRTNLIVALSGLCQNLDPEKIWEKMLEAKTDDENFDHRSQAFFGACIASL